MADSSEANVRIDSTWLRWLLAELCWFKAILMALRGIKVRDIDRVLVILSKNDLFQSKGTDRPDFPNEAQLSRAAMRGDIGIYGGKA